MHVFYFDCHKLFLTLANYYANEGLGLNLSLVAFCQRVPYLKRVLCLGLSVTIAGTVGGAGQLRASAAVQVIDQKTTGVPAGTGMSDKAQSVDQNATPAGLNVQQIPNLIDLPQTPESIERVNKLEEEGEKFFQQHFLDKALSKWQECYGMSLEMKYSEGEGRALTNMCRVFLERGQVVKAKYMGENAIEVLGGASDRKALGRAHLYLAQAYFGLDNPVWAGEQLEAAMKDFTNAGGNNASDTARLMTLAASILMKIGKVKEAVQFYEASGTYYSQAGDYGRAIASHLRVVDVFLLLGLLTAAEEEAEKAVAIAKSAPNEPSNLVAALSAQANCRYTLGDYGLARKCYEQISQLADKMSAAQLNNISRAQVCLGYGSTLLACGDIDQARAMLERALATFKTSGLSLPQAETANVLGVLEASQGHLEKGMTLVNEALDLTNLISPKNDVFHIQILANLAALESRAGHNRDARIHLENAVGPAKKMGDFAQLGRLYTSEGEVAIRLADEPLAESLLVSAIAQSQKVNDDSALWREHTLLAKLQLSQNKTKEARESLLSALSFLRSPQSGAFPAPERIAYPIAKEDLVEQLVVMLVSEKMTEQAFLVAEQIKEESMASAWLKNGGQVRADDQELFNDLVMQRAHLHSAEVSSPPSKIIKDWQEWMTRFRAFSSQNRQLARLIAPLPIVMPEIFKALQSARATVLDYLVGSDSTVVFAVSGNGQLTAEILPVGRKKLEAQVSALLAAMPKADDTTQRSSVAEKKILQSLYGELMPPSVVSLLPGNPDQVVTIIPDGILFNLPFAALMTDQGKYFIEHHTITLGSSITMYLDTPPRYADDLSLVIASLSPAGDANQDESGQIASLFEPELVTRLVGKDAGIKALEEQFKGKAVVHVTDLLKFASGNPLKVTLPMGFSRDDANKKPVASSLFAASIPSDLFVWSSTAVNTKDVDGEAVKVFARGLNYSGVRNVLMSLWVQPDSERISELIDFYKNRQSGLNQADALRKAELSALARDSAPHLWAAYQLIGPGY